MKAYVRFVRPVVDRVAAALLVILLLPFLSAVALLVLVCLGRPVFFRQVRPGLRGRPFELVKFRTMRPGPGSGAERLTGLGRFLRRLSIDELPELWNVLRGEMGLIGPRPLMMEYLARYTPEQARRHEVRPGITGLAQVRGRRRLTFSRRIELDVWYVDHQSPWLDLKILGLTVAAVLFTKGDEPGQTVRDVDDLGPRPDYPSPLPSPPRGEEEKEASR
ncbi:MAG: sugar transferase [bacterium]